MRFIKLLFWPLDRIDARIERHLWLKDCAQFDELRGFALEDLQDGEAERWATNIKRAPAAS